jgi:hypothetical protein
VVTWSKNNATANVADAARSGKITATVERNGKKATKEAITTQNSEAISSYGAWTFNVTANTSNIAAKGGSVTFTISRPTRTITYDTGDTQTETATAGTFALTRSNSSFTLSTTSISMTSSSLPTFTLSVGATGAAAVAAISSTVTAAFTALNPTSGTKTAIKTSGAITRSASTLMYDEYKFSTFSVAKSSFTAAAGTTTLSMEVQKRSIYTGYQDSGWSPITPASGTLSVTAGTGGSVGTITYGKTSTCTINVAKYTNTSADRTISISGNYNSGDATSSINLSQTKDVIDSYSNPVVVFNNYGSKNAASGTVSISSTPTYSQIATYVSGDTKTITSGGSIKYSGSATGATVNTSTGAVTWTANTDTYNSRSVTVTATVTLNDKSGSDTATSTQNKDVIDICGRPTILIGNGLTAKGGSATVTSSVTNRWVSGTDRAGEVSLAITSNGNNRFSLSGTTVSHSNMTTNNVTDTVTVTATNKGDSTKSASASKSITNNYKESGGIKTYGTVTKGSITNTTIPASGTTTNYTATAGNGTQSYSKTAVIRTFDSESTLIVTEASSGNETIPPSHSSISATALSRGTTPSDTTTVKSQVVTWESKDGNTSKNVTGTMYIYQAANSITYGTPTIGSFSYSNVGPTNVSKTVSPSISSSVINTWTSGSEVPGTVNLSYEETTASSYATVNTSSGVVTWDANGGVTSDRSVGITVTAKNADDVSKVVTKAATSKCLKDSVKSDWTIVSYGTPIITYTNTTLTPAA